MAEEINNPTPEELRKQIQERLANMKQSSDSVENSTTIETKEVVEPISAKKEEIGAAVKPEEKAKVADKKVTSAKKEVGKATNGAKDDEPKSNKKSMIILLTVLLVGVIGLFTWQLLKTQELKQVNEQKDIKISALDEEKASIKKELETLYKDYENVTTTNADLNSQLQGEKQKIQEYLEQIDKLKGDASQVAKYRQQLKDLQISRERFVAQIDSLSAVNKVLIEANSKMTSDLEQKNSENTQLSDKVTTAKRVKGFNLSVKSLNVKGKDNTKARKVDEFKICITLMENELADAGEKKIYVRIVEPSGQIMVKAKENYFLDVNNNELAYSAMGTVGYQNAKIETCVSYNGMTGELVEGNYDFEVYTDGQIIGSTNVSLK